MLRRACYYRSMETGKPRKGDISQIAYQIVQEATKEVNQEPATTPIREKNPAAVALGRLGASKGGKARAEKLSKKRRKEIAKEAAKARWSNKEKTP